MHRTPPNHSSGYEDTQGDLLSFGSIVLFNKLCDHQVDGPCDSDRDSDSSKAYLLDDDVELYSQDEEEIDSEGERGINEETHKQKMSRLKYELQTFEYYKKRREHIDIKKTRRHY
jgi:hypothetical protein